jgi:hypothetical protein
MNDTLLSSIFSALSGNAELAALVGDNIYPVRAPQPTPPPYVVFSQVSGSVRAVMSGPSNDREARIQFDIFARRYSEVDDIRDAITTLLHGRTGQTGSTDGWFFLQDNALDLYEDADRLFHAVIDYRIGYSVPVST